MNEASLGTSETWLKCIILKRDSAGRCLSELCNTILNIWFLVNWKRGKLLSFSSVLKAQLKHWVCDFETPKRRFIISTRNFPPRRFVSKCADLQPMATFARKTGDCRGEEQRWSTNGHSLVTSGLETGDKSVPEGTKRGVIQTHADHVIFRDHLLSLMCCVTILRTLCFLLVSCTYVVKSCFLIPITLQQFQTYEVTCNL